jgi:flagellin
MVINHNISAIDAHRNLKVNFKNLHNDAEKLASGMRINKAADDAAGLAVSEKMRSQIRGLNQASRNAQDGISLIQTAEGWLNETTSLVQRMRELSVQSANGTYTNEDRQMIQTEVKQLISEVTRISEDAEFNTISVLNDLKSPERAPGEEGSAPLEGNTLRLHIGANVDQTMNINIGNMSATSLGIEAVDLSTQDSANSAITSLDSALFKVNRQRADLGAFQNRLTDTIKGVDIAAQNLQSAESQIRDTDIANQMVDYVKDQILSQASASMLSQANVRPNMVMKVLQ